MTMDNNRTHDLHDKRLADAWATLQAHSDKGLPLHTDPSRLAFADPEFLLRRETRGLRMQLELMKPDLEMRAHGIENTVVVFGSARFRSEEESGALIAQAEAAGDSVAAERWRRLARSSHYYEKARAFGKLVAQYSNDREPQDKLFVCTSVMTSNSSSSVPKPPGKATSAFARIMKCILRIAK